MTEIIDEEEIPEEKDFADADEQQWFEDESMRTWEENQGIHDDE